MSTTLSTTYTSSKSWSHSVQVGVSVNTQITISSPAEGVLGGATATYGFERSFSYR